MGNLVVLTPRGPGYILWLHMGTKIRKWGNSLGVRLPKAAAEEAGLSDGSEVEVRVQYGAIVLRPVKKPRFKLKDLLAAIRPDNIHPEIDAGPPRGREIL